MVSTTSVTILLCATCAAALRGRATKNARRQRRIQAISIEWAKESFPAVNKLAELMKSASCENEGDVWTKQCHFNTTGCNLMKVDRHKSICTNLVKKDKCEFLSYGVNKDVSFDNNLAKEYGCKGIVHNPLIANTSFTPTQLVQFANLTFKQIGAPVLLIGGNSGPSFEVQPPTETQKELKEERITVLKMDCQGCEYAIASNVLKQDPKFFHKVEQFALRVHVDKRFLSTQEHLHEYNRLLQLIDEAGLQLMDARLEGCGEDKEWKNWRPPIWGPARQSHFIQGAVHEKCLPELLETGYECRLNCQNFLFARPAVVEEKTEKEEKKEQALITSLAG